ncbi:GTPase [Vibrio metschnikovii]|uniref:GTPase n=1 Tax=Vibrio metschnikovii TaxID=28172 RepID=UPI001C3088C3|nr:GTPase [Vibrio metschnikovii]
MKANNLTALVDADDLIKRSSSILERKQDENKPIIAVWGMMNAGKSYLLNMLTQHYNAEFFPTNDIRETAELKLFEGESYIFLDTPGLDANKDDDLIALGGAAQADLVLFVHQPQGELEKLELDFLKQLKESFGEYAEQQIVLVISKADAESQDKIEQIEQKVLEQCHEYLGFSPVSFQISGTRFHKGIQLSKDGLVKASHLQELKQHIDVLSIDFYAIRQEKQRCAINDLLEDVLKLEQELIDEKEIIINELDFKFSIFNEAMSSLDLSMISKKTEFMKARLQGV